VSSLPQQETSVFYFSRPASYAGRTVRDLDSGGLLPSAQVLPEEVSMERQRISLGKETGMQSWLWRGVGAGIVWVWVGQIGGAEWITGQFLPPLPSETSWRISAGGMILHRSNPRPWTFSQDNLQDPPDLDEEMPLVPLRPSDLALDWAGGWEIQMGYEMPSGWGIAARYFQVDGWESTLSEQQTELIPISLFLRYHSRIYSTELNLTRRLGERFRFLMGFRWVELHEKFLSDLEIETPLFGFQMTTSFPVGNYLYGFQIGTEAGLFEYGRLRVDGFLRAGIYGNRIVRDGHFRIRVEELEVGDSVRFAKSRASFLGEIGLLAKYHLLPNLVLYGGYQVMWLEGVGLAPELLLAFERDEERVLWEGTCFYHGAIMGLEFRW